MRCSSHWGTEIYIYIYTYNVCINTNISIIITQLPEYKFQGKFALNYQTLINSRQTSSQSSSKRTNTLLSIIQLPNFHDPRGSIVIKLEHRIHRINARRRELANHLLELASHLIIIDSDIWPTNDTQTSLLTRF